MSDPLDAAPRPRLIIGVGGARGSLEALEALLRTLSASTGAAFVIALPPESDVRGTVERFGALSESLEVKEAIDGAALAADTAYLAGAEMTVLIRAHRLEVKAGDTARPGRHPIDALLRSIADEAGPRSVGIVLSGSGVVGTAGLREIGAAGGLAIAQDPSTAVEPGMPRMAIDAGVAELVLAPHSIPAALARYAAMAEGSTDCAVEAATEDLDAGLGELAKAIAVGQGLDIDRFKRGTLHRRVRRRMNLTGFDRVEAYVEHARAHEAEQRALARDLLIRVTAFFRDPDAFEALRTKALCEMVAEAPPGAVLRAWVPGCATGEEPYSIAMLLLEEIEAQRRNLHLQVFATDIDEEALAIARAGIYAPSSLETISEPRRRAYFREHDGRFRVQPRLRDVMSFAVHDICADPPLSRMDLVSCRNVLIYLHPEAQERVLRSLHFAVRSTGVLFLGASESVGPRRELFTSVCKAARIYRPLPASGRVVTRHGASNGGNDRVGWRGTVQGARRREPNLGELARDALLAARVPPSVVVGEDGQILFTHGDLGEVLRFPSGEPRMLLLAALRDDLATRVRAAMHTCRRDGTTVSVTAMHDASDGRQTEIVATPAPALGSGAIVLSFRTSEAPEHAPHEPSVHSAEAHDVAEQLERELQATREDLRTTVEELESSNEELRAANEEAASMNEELQSANEELEAASEELRSVNNELSTVNVELQRKVELVEQARDDLANFFASTKLATLFLDEQLRVARATPAAQELLRLEPGDEGRPIAEIASAHLKDGLAHEARSVLDTLTAVDRELQIDDRWLARRVLPYRTHRRRIEGVVVTFLDVTEMKQATELALRRERRQRMLARLLQAALESEDLAALMQLVVQDVREVLAVDGCGVVEEQGPGRTVLRAGRAWDDEHAALTVPIRRESNVYGVLGAWTRERRAFSAEDIDFLQAIANLLAGAIAIERAHRRLAIERGVAQCLVDARSLDAAAPRVFDVFARELGTVVGELWVAQPDGSAERSVLSWARTPPLSGALGGPRLERGQGVVADVLATGHARWIPSLDAEPAFSRHEWTRKLGLVCALAFAIVDRERTIGAITLFSDHPLLSDPDLLPSLDAIGRTLGEFVRRVDAETVYRRLAYLVESSDDAIIGKSPEGIIQSWNRGAERLYGYSAEEVIGKPIRIITPTDREDEIDWILEELRRGGRVDHYDTVRRRKDGSLVDVSVTISPIEDPDGRVVGWSAVARDVSGRRRLQDALLEADRQKNQFLAMLGHELRNPLAAVRSATELLALRSTTDSGVQHAHAVLDRQVVHIGKLVDGLLDVSRIVQGRIQLDTRVVDVVEVLGQVLSDRRAGVESAGLDLHIDLAPSPVWVRGDPVRLAQIFDNLVSNASKFTRAPGSIDVSVRREAEQAVVTIRDTGVGIDPRLLPYVFEPFRQAAQELDRSAGGLGLGLALVKGLIDLHGGQVDVHSEGIGAGTLFTVSLPLGVAPAVEAPRVATPCVPLRLLLVEDNEDAAILMAEVLRARGHDVDVAHDGNAGLSSVRVRRPDAVLCDIGLPGGMSGYDVARVLRGDPELSGIVLVALTGYGRQEDRSEALDAGFDAHVTKPADTSQLEQVLATHVERRRHQA